jgi:lysophospholipase L1-like esterase
MLLYGNSFLPNKPLITFPIKIACVGDSITERSAYTNTLQSMLGDDYAVGNFGVSSSTVSHASFKPYINQTQYDDAVNFDPDIVVIMLGTNDAHTDMEHHLANFENDYTALTDSFQDLENSPHVFVVKSPPVYSNKIDIDPSFFSNSIIPQIQNVADQQNLPVVDVYGAFGNHSEYTVDGVHPNDDGAALIASTVYHAITEEDYIRASYGN